MDSDDWFTLEELAGRLGALAWVEQHLGDVLSEWSTIESHAPTAIYFASAAHHHRWHSEIVSSCLPTSPRLREIEVVRAPTQGWRDAVATLRELGAPEATAARLRSLARHVDPWLDRETAALRDVCQPISDAPLLRWLRFVCLDHDEDAVILGELLAARSSDAVHLDEHVVVNEIDLTHD